MSSRLISSIAAALLVVASSACAAIPADPKGTLERASGGVLRVGMSEHPPWTELDDGARTGVEVDLIEGFAESIDAEIGWQDGGEEHLIEELHAGSLDVVIGGLTAASPWVEQAALTRPYVVVTSSSGSPEPHVMASRMGENALLVALERHLEQHEAEVAERVDGARP